MIVLLEGGKHTMYNKIKEIIQKAKELKNNGRTDLEIAKFVHIELGKILIFNNNYTSKIEKNITNEQGKKINIQTEISKKRSEELRNAPTNINSNVQICKGMAEIYSGILTELGMYARVIGVEKLGLLGGTRDECGTKVDILEDYSVTLNSNGINKANITNNSSGHYYSIFRTNEGEYISDLLMEKTIARAKCNEISINGEIPGICNKNNYYERKNNPLNNINKNFVLSLRSKLSEYAKNRDYISIRDKIDFIFQEVNELSNKCGFEELKDCIYIYFQTLLSNEEKKDFIDNSKTSILVKENINSCKVISICNFKGNNYLIKDNLNSDIPFNIGKLDSKNINKILINGYIPRKPLDKENLTKIIEEKNLEEER